MRRVIVRRGSTRLAEELSQAVDDRIDVLSERTGGDGVVAVADEVSRGCRVVKEVGEDGSVDR